VSGAEAVKKRRSLVPDVFKFVPKSSKASTLIVADTTATAVSLQGPTNFTDPFGTSGGTWTQSAGDAAGCFFNWEILLTRNGTLKNELFD
jgi:hypothetical protein